MNFEIRLVVPEDASFILDLRNNEKLNQFISPTSTNTQEQIDWIKAYKKREAEKKEFYFIVLEDGIKKGLYRIYNINDHSFTIGSWLFDSCKAIYLPILTDVVVSEFGFYDLKVPILLFDVRKKNKKVIRYHLLKKPLLYNEDESNNYYLLKLENWDKTREKIISTFNIPSNEYRHMKSMLAKIAKQL